MSKLNQPSAARAVENDEQRSVTATGQAEFQISKLSASDRQTSIGELSFRSSMTLPLESLQRICEYRIGIAFFFQKQATSNRVL
ncbi:hypothetical protein CMV_005473 [Castanea mollissima]|uniref:Uncharacterized protein n=1 Tax=Castanea mollissima TaxID=60419 RepID=A0A8J4RSN3_9ROSI|nr:hypothetical protein CMV_005473 [Castanea mollissima]